MFKRAYSYKTIGYQLPTARNISAAITENGKITNTEKVGVVFDDLLTRNSLVFFIFKDGINAAIKAAAQELDGHRALIFFDYQTPRNVAIRSVYIQQDTHFSIDLNDGAGSGGAEQTNEATLDAVIKVDGDFSKRTVIAVENTTDDRWRYAGSSAVDKEGIVELKVTGGDVYAFAIDDFGKPFQANLAVEIGDTIRPSEMLGWLYKITQAGTLPSIEPKWWSIEGDNPTQQLGTARAQAIRYYQPIAHGPIPVELVINK
ncbi:hypothetical protein VQ643_09450 [Pseudomonas sp. F1_0610]|uniref:hypothetical protein n=1 Tax=Pseudomonas sp. F1_0610 TaxID=3114284 RepID=UPI0039C16FE0